MQHEIVEYREHGKVASAVVICEGEPILVLTERGREFRLPSGRVVHRTGRTLAFHDKDNALKQLEDYCNSANDLASSVNAEVLWERTKDMGETKSLDFLARLWFGDSGPLQRSAILRALASSRELFKQSKAGFQPRPKDKVEKRRREAQERIEEEKRRQEFSSWLKDKSNGTDCGPPPDGSSQYMDVLADFAASNAPSASSLEQDLLVRAGLTPDEVTPTAAFDLLVRAGVFTKDENLLLRKYARRTEFPNEVETAANELVTRPLPKRREVSAGFIVSIDDPETSEIDDAVQLISRRRQGGWQVAVYIADPDEIVPAGHVLDREAMKRGTTLYLPDRRIPMFPPAVADNAASLVKGRKRPALAFELEITEEGEIISSNVEPVNVVVSQRLSFEEVEDLLAGKDPELNDLLACSDALRKKRHSAGAYLLMKPDVVPRLTREGEIRLKRYNASSASGRLVAELMIAANRTAARVCEDAGVPAPFRVQTRSKGPAPPQPALEAPYDPLSLYDLLRSIDRTHVRMEPGPHAGLGVESYMQITSPLRRYTDLLGHRQLKAALSGANPPYTRAELEQLVKQSERLVAEARIVENWARDYYLLKYLAGRLGEKVEAVVLRWFNGRLLVELEDYAFRTTVKWPTPVAHGKRLWFEISRVHPREGRLDLEPAEGPSQSEE